MIIKKFNKKTKETIYYNSFESAIVAEKLAHSTLMNYLKQDSLANFRYSSLTEMELEEVIYKAHVTSLHFNHKNSFVINVTTGEIYISKNRALRRLGLTGSLDNHIDKDKKINGQTMIYMAVEPIINKVKKRKEAKIAKVAKENKQISIEDIKPKDISKDTDTVICSPADYTYNLSEAAKIIGTNEEHIIDLLKDKFLNDSDFEIETKTIVVVKDCKMNSKGFGKLFAKATSPSPIDVMKAKMKKIKETNS